MPKQKKKRSLVVIGIRLDKDKGLIFEMSDDKDYAYKYYHDASGAISEITLEEI